MHESVTNPSYITIPTTGRYHFGTTMNSDTNATGYGYVILNGATHIGDIGVGNSGANTANGTFQSKPYYFTVGDYIQVYNSF